MADETYAFKCRNCGRIEGAAHAGERQVPASCRVCGAGVSFTPQGIKTYDEDNWIVLASLSDEELAPILAYHAIDKSQIVAHTPDAPADPDHVPTFIAVEAVDGIVTEDKHE